VPSLSSTAAGYIANRVPTWDQRRRILAGLPRQPAQMLAFVWQSGNNPEPHKPLWRCAHCRSQTLYRPMNLVDYRITSDFFTTPFVALLCSTACRQEYVRSSFTEKHRQQQLRESSVSQPALVHPFSPTQQHL